MLTKQDCRVIIGSTLSGLVACFGRELVEAMAISAFHQIRGYVRNTDIPPPPEKDYDYANSVVVCRVVGAMARGLTQLTEANIVVSALGELVQDDTFWKLCVVANQISHEQVEALKKKTSSVQDLSDCIKKIIDKQGGIGPFDKVEKGEDWHG